MANSTSQNAMYIMNNINAILYGVVLVLYFRVLRYMFSGSKKWTFMDKFMMAFSTLLVILNTIFWTTQSYFGEMMWIVHSDYPGGADAYWIDFGSVWYQTWGMAACVVCNLMNDAFLVYRCFVIWNSRRIIIFPGVLWLASLASGCCTSRAPDGNYFAGIATIFVTAYTASTFAFNVVVTSLIIARILYIGRRLAFADEFKVYIGAVAIMIESALPFTVFSAAYLVTYAMGSDISIGFSFYAMFTCISPLLITLRVLSRRAWTRDSSNLFTTTISYTGATDFITNMGAQPEDYDAEKEGTTSKLPDLEAGRRGMEVSDPHSISIVSINIADESSPV
ncbi:hypothetical protein ONZ51_g10355 [Trametes cubensis]|uniref:Uncharacterized protein n=1 Tax=Trametes cubensis TaxID=1111947 RepID=A0AAD7X6T0_9APHY|nr:hypothetical protein ONZ51_g10355 [Trametes cubensis]